MTRPANLWPALEVRCPASDNGLLALVDDFAATAIEDRDNLSRVFFSSVEERDRSLPFFLAAGFDATPVDVDDEDWARRSQADLLPVVVGRLVVTPPWLREPQAEPAHPAETRRQPLVVVVRPSTGFGTGHHATTRLCLLALQAVDLPGRSVLDIGTGSGVLAIAAVMLGAAAALGIDSDDDAIRAANENLELNPGVSSVEFRLADLSAEPLSTADVVTANLTGALLIRSASRLWSLVDPGGVLILSGLLALERDDVVRALAEARPGAAARPSLAQDFVFWEQHEDGWVALGMCCN